MRDDNDGVERGRQRGHGPPDRLDGRLVADPGTRIGINDDAREADAQGAALRGDWHDHAGHGLRERLALRVGDVADNHLEACLGESGAEGGLGDVELVVAEGRVLQPRGVEHVDHLPPGEGAAVDARRAQGRGRQEVAAQRGEQRCRRLAQFSERRGDAGEASGAAAIERPDFVDVVDVREGDGGAGSRRHCGVDAGRAASCRNRTRGAGLQASKGQDRRDGSHVHMTPESPNGGGTHGGIRWAARRQGGQTDGHGTVAPWCGNRRDDARAVTPVPGDYLAAAACRLRLIFTSSPTRTPPVSRAAFHVRPKSLRLMVSSDSNASFSFPHGSRALPR